MSAKHARQRLRSSCENTLLSSNADTHFIDGDIHNGEISIGVLGQLRLYLFRESQYFLVFIHFFFIYLFYFGGVSYFLALFYLIYFETSQLSPSDSIGYAIHVTKVTLCFYVCTDLTTSRLFNENEGNGFWCKKQKNRTHQVNCKWGVQTKLSAFNTKRLWRIR